MGRWTRKRPNIRGSALASAVIGLPFSMLSAAEVPAVPDCSGLDLGSLLWATPVDVAALAVLWLQLVSYVVSPQVVLPDDPLVRAYLRSVVGGGVGRGVITGLTSCTVRLGTGRGALGLRRQELSGRLRYRDRW
jgi:hypothetical protein